MGTARLGRGCERIGYPLRSRRPAHGSIYFKNGQPVHGRHHEFGITPTYVVQSGRFKQTKIALIAMWHVGSTYYSDPTSQVYRLVVTVPARLF